MSDNADSISSPDLISHKKNSYEAFHEPGESYFEPFLMWVTNCMEKYYQN